MGGLREDFVLHPGVTIEDAMETIKYWRSGSDVGGKYKMWIQKEYVRLERSWYPAGNYLLLIFAPLIFGLICFFMSKARVIITLWFSETVDSIGVHFLLEGKAAERMEDYTSLRERLLAIGAPSPYVRGPRTEEGPSIEGLTPPIPESSLSKVWHLTPTDRCPYCGAEVPLDGTTRPDGSVICPKCFGKFVPGEA
jgi:hypothetical protein